MVELDDARIDGGKIEDVVDDRQKQRGRGRDMVDIFRLPLGQRAEGRRLQEIGEADDVGQRRAQFVGNVLDEVVLQLRRPSQRFVLLGQRALDPHAVGDVDEGQHGLGVRQRNDGEVEDQPGAQFETCPGTSGRSSSKLVMRCENRFQPSGWS